MNKKEVDRLKEIVNRFGLKASKKTADIDFLYSMLRKESRKRIELKRICKLTRVSEIGVGIAMGIALGFALWF